VSQQSQKLTCHPFRVVGVPVRLSSRTLQAKYEAKDGSTSLSCTILRHANHKEDFHFQLKPHSPADETPSLSYPRPPTWVIENVRIKATYITVLTVVVAQKLTKADEIPLFKSSRQEIGSTE
jgi:hypothetical protein